MTKQLNYNVGIYVRLSQEDERAGESISIENQKIMLKDYVNKQSGWNIVDIYEDDEKIIFYLYYFSAILYRNYL